MERHPFDAVTFVFGALFVAAGLVLVTGTADAIPMSWAGPLVAIGLGVVILVASWPRRARDEDEPHPEGAGASSGTSN